MESKFWTRFVILLVVGTVLIFILNGSLFSSPVRFGVDVNDNEGFDTTSKSEVDLTSERKAEVVLTNPTEVNTERIDNSFENVSVKVHMAEELLKTFAAEIQHIRESLLSNLSASPWQPVKGPLQVINGYKAGYFEQILNYPHIQTLKLVANIDRLKEVLTESYYDYSGNDCALMDNKCIYAKAGVDLYNIRCLPGIKDTLKPNPLQTQALSPGLPEGTANPENTDLKLLTFIHIITNAYVTTQGDVFSRNTKIVPQHCSQDTRGEVPGGIDSKPYHKEVLDIAQFWGEGFFHGTLEDLPRISPYLTFLRQNPEIKIHLNSVQGFMKGLLSRLGIPADRLISGNIRAGILYMPAGSPCGRSPLFTTQLLSMYHRNTIQPAPTVRNYIILVKRSAKRYFSNHNAIYSMLIKVAKDYGLNTWEFKDAPVPPLDKGMFMFRSALMVVAPHGAGEANLMFSEPGTILVEGLCYPCNHCFRNMAASLGLRYYGMLRSDSCLKVEPADLETPIRTYLDLLSHT